MLSQWKQKACVTLISFGLVSYFLQVSAAAKTRAPASTIELGTRIGRAVEAMLPPGSAKCAVGQLMETVRPEEYGSDGLVAATNEGMQQYFNYVILKNPCFADTAKEFWQKIESQAEREGGFDSKPALSERAGEGRYSRYREGWLWERAIGVTKGDPNMAIALLSICMHDDGKMYVGTHTPQRALEDALAERIKRAKERLSKLQNELAPLSPTLRSAQAKQADIVTTTKEIRKLEADLQGIARRAPFEFTCPGAFSPAFAPRSVDPSLDLPDELKLTIAKVQRPKGGPKDLPAKSYHFMAGAFVGCQMAQCGVSADTAAKVAGFLASTYRAIRLCPTIKKSRQDLMNVVDAIDVEPNSPDFIPAYRRYLVESMKLGALDPNSTEAIELMKMIDDAIDKAIVDMDAATLYSKWYFGGPNALAGDTPCTEIRLGGPDDLNEVDMAKLPQAPHLKPRAGTTSCGIVGWSVERCERARMKLSTWDVDFKWTRTQHELGARFAAGKCKPQDVKQSYDDRLCKK